MKKFTMFVCMMMVIVGIAGMADVSQALLLPAVQYGVELVYDDVTATHWIWDMSAYTNRSYAQQINDISADSDSNITLHMATAEEMLQLWQYSYQAIFDAFNPPDQGNQEMFMLGRYDDGSAEYPGYHYMAGFVSETNGQLVATDPASIVLEDRAGSPIIGAWVVADVITGGPNTPVPEPTTLLLLGAGLVGVVNLCRKRKK